MIAATICTFTVIDVVVRILLTTFPAHFLSSTIILMMAIFLAFVTSQWVGYVLLDPFHCIANFYFFGYFWVLNCIIYVFVYCFPFFARHSFHFSHTLLFLALFISSMVHKESSLILTTPLRSEICEGLF